MTTFYETNRRYKYDSGDFGRRKVFVPPPTVGRHYLNVPFEDKEKARAKGAKWDGEKKQWYIPEGTRDHMRKFAEWIPSLRDEHGNLLLEVPYEQKDAAKALGARWNAVLKRWFVTKGMDIEPFRRWLT